VTAEIQQYQNEPYCLDTESSIQVSIVSTWPVHFIINPIYINIVCVNKTIMIYILPGNIDDKQFLSNV